MIEQACATDSEPEVPRHKGPAGARDSAAKTASSEPPAAALGRTPGPGRYY
jgi:hypothetical protein